MSPKGGSAGGLRLCRGRAEGLGWVDPAARRGSHRPVPTRANHRSGRFERAIARFNAASAARTVAGLMRTLGEPWVSVGAAAGTPDEVRVTVAWELTWYQWGVDLGDELRAVYPDRQGLRGAASSTPPPASGTPARASGGQLRLGAPAPGRAPDGERSPCSTVMAG